jgi:hypothetical protein
MIISEEEEYDRMKTTITKHLPDGWSIEITRPDHRHPHSFTLNKDGVYIAGGLNGMEYWGNYRRYDMEITKYSIYEAKPIVDKIMDEYNSAVEKEQLEKQEKDRIDSEVALKIAFDKRQKEARTVLGLPLDGPVVEYHDVVECDPIEVKRRSMFSRIFG